MSQSGGKRSHPPILLLLALIVAAAGAWLASVPPRALAPEAPPAAFSAGRAMADVRAIGRAAHPAGSAEHAQVRLRLVARMAALGLSPRVLGGRAVKVKSGAARVEVSGADVANLLGILPGTDRTAPAVLLMAHYDSVPSSPGAADDGAGVAAALEIVRALAADGPRYRDVMLLFTDAEENGLLGARAFFAQGGGRRVGFVINMDTRGGAGRAIMHETGRLSGGAIDLYRRSAAHPTTDSIAAYVERLIRNSSDFRIAADHGLNGLNFALLDRQFDYHAASSTPDALDTRSLQHLGAQVLDVTRAAVAMAALPVRAPDPAYASVLGRFVMAYPAWAGWPILLAGIALAALAWRRDPVPPAELLRALGAAGHLLLTLALLLALARIATGVPFGFTVGRPLLARWELYEAALALLCVGGVVAWGALAASGARVVADAAPVLIAGLVLTTGAAGWITPAMAVLAVLLAVPCFRAPLRPRAIAAGLFAAVALIATVLQIAAPVANVVPSWTVAGAGAILLATGGRSGLRIAAALVAGLLVAQQLATAHLLMLAVGETIAGVAAPFALFAALALAPLLAPLPGVRPAIWSGAAVVGIAAILVLAIRLFDGASAVRPAISQIVHVSDVTRGRFYRATSLMQPDAWTRAELGPAAVPSPLPPLYDHGLLAPGEPIAAAPVRMRWLRRPDGAVLLRVAGPPGTRDLRLSLRASVPIRHVQVNGFAVPLLAEPGRTDRLEWVGRDATVLLLIVPPRGHGALTVRASALRDGWPAGARKLHQRPATIMPWYESDAAVTLATGTIGW